MDWALLGNIALGAITAGAKALSEKKMEEEAIENAKLMKLYETAYRERYGDVGQGGGWSYYHKNNKTAFDYLFPVITSGVTNYFSNKFGNDGPEHNYQTPEVPKTNNQLTNNDQMLTSEQMVNIMNNIRNGEKIDYQQFIQIPKETNYFRAVLGMTPTNPPIGLTSGINYFLSDTNNKFDIAPIGRLGLKLIKRTL